MGHACFVNSSNCFVCMNSSLVYIAWPITLALAVGVGSMIGNNGKDGGANSQQSVQRKSSYRGGSTSLSESSRLRNARRNPTTVGNSKHGRDSHFQLADEDKLSALVYELDRRGVDEYSELFESIGDEEYSVVCKRLIVARWAKTDPYGVLDYLKQHHEESSIGAAIESWASYDDVEAVKWVIANNKGLSQEKLLLDCIKAMTRNDTERSTHIANLIEADHLRADCLTHLAKGAVLRGDASLLLERAAQPQARSFLVGELAAEFAKTDLTAGEHFCSNLVDEELDQFLLSFGSTWVKLDPREALLWGGGKADKLKDPVLTQGLPVLLKREGVEALDFVESLTAAYPTALARYQNLLLHHSSETRQALLERVPPARRTRLEQQFRENAALSRLFSSGQIQDEIPFYVRGPGFDSTKLLFKWE